MNRPAPKSSDQAMSLGLNDAAPPPDQGRQTVTWAINQARCGSSPPIAVREMASSTGASPASLARWIEAPNEDLFVLAAGRPWPNDGSQCVIKGCEFPARWHAVRIGDGPLT